MIDIFHYFISILGPSYSSLSFSIQDAEKTGNGVQDTDRIVKNTQDTNEIANGIQDTDKIIKYNNHILEIANGIQDTDKNC